MTAYRTDPRQMAAYRIAKSMIGITEIEGADHNPEIVKFFWESGHRWVKDDETAWCAAFVGACLKRAGMEGTGKLNARSYLDWGEPVDPSDAKPGDLGIFWRGRPDSWQGHVGFVVSSGREYITVLGGNQSNAVSKQPYKTSRLLGVRRAKVPYVEKGSWLTRFLRRFKR